MRFRNLRPPVLMAATVMAALGGAAQAGPTLDKVKQAGQISCGVQTGQRRFCRTRQPGPVGRLQYRYLQGVVCGDLRRRRQGEIRAADRAAAFYRLAIGRGRPAGEQHDRHLAARHRTRAQFRAGGVL